RKLGDWVVGADELPDALADEPACTVGVSLEHHAVTAHERGRGDVPDDRPELRGELEPRASRVADLPLEPFELLRPRRPADGTRSASAVELPRRGQPVAHGRNEANENEGAEDVEVDLDGEPAPPWAEIDDEGEHHGRGQSHAREPHDEPSHRASSARRSPSAASASRRMGSSITWLLNLACSKRAVNRAVAALLAERCSSARRRYS